MAFEHLFVLLSDIPRFHLSTRWYDEFLHLGNLVPHRPYTLHFKRLLFFSFPFYIWAMDKLLYGFPILMSKDFSSPMRREGFVCRESQVPILFMLTSRSPVPRVFVKTPAALLSNPNLCLIFFFPSLCHLFSAVWRNLELSIFFLLALFFNQVFLCWRIHVDRISYVHFIKCYCSLFTANK